MEKKYTIGVDFGTDSVRSVVIDTGTGEKIASSFFEYPRWRDGLYCDGSKQQYRQHPLDHLEGLEGTIKDCLLKSSIDPKQIKAISVASTGSSPCVVNGAGVPLSLRTGYETDPNAMFILWKDHTAQKEAGEINAHAKKFDVNYLDHSGGIYSAEWFWAKWLHVIRADDRINEYGVSMIEHSDWIPFVLTGGSDVRKIKRNVCAAGHKALWCGKGLPPKDFFTCLDLRFANKVFFDSVYTADQPAGTLCKEWTDRLGLHENVIIGIGALDAHMGAVGANIQPYHLCKVMGTSTCDMLVVPQSHTGTVRDSVKGICGQVEGSIIPGMIGMEAGQSAFGDVFAWWRDILMWPLTLLRDKKLQERIHDYLLIELSRAADSMPLDTNDPLAVDWLNGRRTPGADQSLTAAITGMHLGTDAPQIFKALVEATCFGARAINDCFISQGIPIEGIIALGGIANKSPYTMQMLSDVLQMPIQISGADQACALGAAMFAATAAGIYPNVEAAMNAMNQGFKKEYTPDKNKAKVYDARYRQYRVLGNFIEFQKSGHPL